jgi:hypothetical protein
MIKKLFCIVVVFFTLSNKVFSQNDTCLLDYLPEYRVVDKELYQLLDTLISKAANYDEFVMYNTNLFAIVTVWDTNSFNFQITPHSYNQYNNISVKDSIRGFTFINDHLVIFVFGKSSIVDVFVEQTNKKDSIYIIQSDNMHYHVVPIHYKCFFTKNNNEWVMDEYGNCKEQSNAWFYFYRVQKGDTWEKLAKKFRCSESDIKRHPKERLCVGMYIEVRIRIDNNRKLHCERFL